MAVETYDDKARRYIELKKSIRDDEKALEAVRSRLERLMEESSRLVTELSAGVGENKPNRLITGLVTYTVLVSYRSGVTVFDKAGEEIR